MITIQCIHTSSGIEPGRRLTDTEKTTVTSVLSNGFQFIYYQGDEPIVEEQPIIE